MSNFFSTLQDNWLIITGAICLLLVVAGVVYEVVKKKREQKAAAVVSDIFMASDAGDRGGHYPPAPMPRAAVDAPIAVTVAVTHADRVLAKHAALDKRIADGKAAQAEKDALDALQAQLDKLTEGT